MTKWFSTLKTKIHKLHLCIIPDRQIYLADIALRNQTYMDHLIKKKNSIKIGIYLSLKSKLKKS